MLPFTVRRFQGATSHAKGEEVVLLLRRNGTPYFWPNVYATANYRNTDKAPNTIVRVLRTIGLMHMWATIRGRDLDLDLSSGQFLSVEDVTDLANFLGLTAKAQEKRYQTAHLGGPVVPTKVVELKSKRILRRADEARLSISTEDYAVRLYYARRYAMWHLRRRLGSLDRIKKAREDAEDLKTLGQVVYATFEELTPQIDRKTPDDTALLGFDEAIANFIDKVLTPGSDNNPFTPGFIQDRNFLIWRLMRDTGARRFEVRNALTKNVLHTINRFVIHQGKRVGYTGVIQPDTADHFEHFFRTYWSRFPREVRKEGFLFTDKSGKHLSLRAFNRVFETLRKKVEAIPTTVGPHEVRRYWNNHFSDLVDAQPVEERDAEKDRAMRNRLQGRVPDSKAGDTYIERTIRRKADELAERMFAGINLPPAPKNV